MIKLMQLTRHNAFVLM